MAMDHSDASLYNNNSPDAIKHRHGIKSTVGENERPQIPTKGYVADSHGEADQTDSDGPLG